MQERDPNKIYSPDKCEDDEFITEYVERAQNQIVINCLIGGGAPLNRKILNRYIHTGIKFASNHSKI